MTKPISPEMQAFAAKLAKDRRANAPTKPASPSFVDRMTSSVADPDLAQTEVGDDIPPAPDSNG